jgi:hypothetical protein
MKLVSLTTPLLSVLFICSLILLYGCAGGNGPVFPDLTVGQISGPDRLLDSTFPVYTLNIQGDAAVSCEWSVTPETAGYFANVAGHSAMLCPCQVTADKSITIKAVVRSDYRDDVTRTFDAVVCCTPAQPPGELTVSEIMGGQTVAGNSWVTYGVEVTGGSNVTYAWSVDPQSAGTITHPTSRYTNFAASMTDVERSAVIRVAVNSVNSEEVIRTMIITIVPPDEQTTGLSVGNIIGPGSMVEESTAPFSIVAQGDGGIEYQWSVDPPGAGTFDAPWSPSVNFTASPVNDEYTNSISAELRVVIRSDNHEPVTKSRRVAILETEQIVMWVDAPTEILENQVANYAIDLDPYYYPNIDPPPYRWECDPIWAGTFMVAQGTDNEPDYYITSVYSTEAVFRAAEVQEDVTATISVFYYNEFIDSTEVLIMDDMGKPPDSHWYEPSGIAGPTQVIEAKEDVFYFKIQMGDPSWAYDWSVALVDDIDNGMPWMGQYAYPGTLQPIRDEYDEWNWQTMEFIANNFEAREWLQIISEYEGGEETLLTCVRPVLYPCLFVTEIFPARWYSYYPSGPFPPEEPQDPWFNQPQFNKYGKDPKVIRAGDIVRLFVWIDSYRPDDALLRVSWETEPPGAVHFWGDGPYELADREELWLETFDRIPDEEHPQLRGSHYYIQGGGLMILNWVEMTCRTDEQFDIVLTVESMVCDKAIRVMRFNRE